MTVATRARPSALPNGSAVRSTRPWIVLAIVAAPMIAVADPLTVKVVDVAGDVAYVEPGASAGLVVGTKVKFGPIVRTIVDASTTTASVKLDGLVLSIGETGSASVKLGTGASIKKLDPVHAPDAFRDQWPAAVRPADAQPQVTAVPLGAGGHSGPIHLAVLGQSYASFDRHNATAHGEARVIATFDILQDRPFAGDADVAVRAFSDGFDKAAHTPLFVRALQVRYGSVYDPQLALGRLRFAATSVGMLDGVRAMIRSGSLELAAFGGLVPDPVSGKPDTSVSRFGAEAFYELDNPEWRPRLGVTALGSTWDGQLDERRLTLSASASHESVWLDGWADAQQFASGNQWGANAVELTGAGASVDWRHRGAHLGGDLTFLRPERSLRLAAMLPAEWLCSRAPQPGDVAESCRGDDYWSTATASAGLRRGRFVVDAMGSVGKAHAVTSSYTSSAYVRAELHIDRHRLVLGGSAGQSEFASWTAGEGGLGSAITRTIDVEARYRAELLDYVASTGALLLHAVAADVRYMRSNNFEVGSSLLFTTGADRRDLAILTTVVWRPR